jgi:hypothetical protein
MAGSVPTAGDGNRCRNSLSARIVSTKTEMFAMNIPIGRISCRSPASEWEDEKLRLFENGVTHNLRVSRISEEFFYLNRSQPIEKYRFGKINARKR